MDESPKLCRYCFQKINPLATVCHHCSKLQTGFFKFLNYITVAEVLSFLISLGLLWFSVAQFNTARWKYPTGKSSEVCFSNHLALASDWHLGQWRLRQEL